MERGWQWGDGQGEPARGRGCSQICQQQWQEVAGDGVGVSGGDVPCPTGTAEESPPEFQTLVPKEQPKAVTTAGFTPRGISARYLALLLHHRALLWVWGRLTRRPQRSLPA